MIRKISLRNFKSASDLSIRTEQLTLLTGLNSSGKSTVLQALALLKQSDLPRATSLRLLGDLVHLGVYADVQTHGSDADSTAISLEDEVGRYEWIFGANRDRSNVAIDSGPGELPDFLVGKQFQFLQADRIVPSNVYPRSVDGLVESGFLGSRGEFAIEFLASDEAVRFSVSSARVSPSDGLHVSADLLLKAAPTLGLVDQVAGWLQQLSPGIRVSADELAGTDSYRLRYDYVGREGFSETSEKIRPSNVGFGLTYSLPIVVACLSAEPGALLLIENPEAHLHPQGQAALGRLIAMAAADGVQILLETHSDHVLNGIRLAVKQKILTPSQVALHYFTRNVETGHADVESPAIMEDGSVSDWPRGFFDQWDRALDALLGN